MPAGPKAMIAPVGAPKGGTPAAITPTVVAAVSQPAEPLFTKTFQDDGMSELLLDFRTVVCSATLVYM